MGGRGENICTSRLEGGGGAGATREALASGERAGAGAASPGGGEKAGVEGEKKVRLGLAVMGVPSSSSSVGGGVMGCESQLEVASSWMDEPVVQAVWALELEVRAWKKGGGAMAVEGGW